MFLWFLCNRRRKDDMWAKQKALALVLLMALTIVPLATLGGSSPQVPAGTGSQNVYLLSFASTASMQVLPALGMKVVTDYNNGYYLVKGPEYETQYLGELGIHVRDMPERTAVKFEAAGYEFDTAMGEPSLPWYLTSTTSDERIVQFIGPIKSEWVDAAESTGVTLRDYAENYAYIGKMSDEQVAAVKELPFVGWVGQYQPAYKIQSELRTMTGIVPISVVAYDGVTEEQLISILQGRGAEVTQTSNLPTTAEAFAPSSLIPYIAASSDISQIFWSPEKVTLDWQAGEVHKFHQAWSPAKSGLTSNLTGHSPGPDGIMGNADDIFEVVGIQDSGFDLNTPNNGWIDTFKGPLGDRVVGLRRQTAQCSQPDGRTNGVAHGTHVAGIIVSNGYGWEKQYGLPTDDMEWDQSEAGSVPEGKLSFDCVGSGGGIASSPAYWDLEYADGAKTMTNSYGTPNRVYDNTAMAVDMRMDASNDKMILFAVGNDGPDPNTVSGIAKAKNGLGIGASQNFRPDQFEADNPNLMADFSSRGNPGERYKPDLVAIGTAVVSGLGVGEWLYNAGPGGAGVPQPDYILGVDQYDYRIPGIGQDGITDYRYMQGTSMASPQAAGLYMLTREYFREIWGINNVNSQLAKAMLINGAVRMDQNLYEYPGIDQGWGRIDLQQSLFPPAPRSNQFEEGLLTTTGTWRPSTINMNIATPDVPLKVTLVWIDAQGFNLVRNLDLIVRNPDGSAEFHGNQYATSGPLKGWTDPTRVGYDSKNNVEQVEVNFPSPGLWTVEVKGFSVPSTAKFALVFSADVGPRKTYQVNIESNYPTILSVAPGGTASLPFIVRNFGSAEDTISVSHNAPGTLGVSFDWPVAYFQPGDSKDDLAIFSASVSTPPDLYSFCIKAESGNDTATPKNSGSLCLQVEVLGERLPYARRITNQPIDELDPSVLTFNSSGVNHIFIAYRKTTPIDPLDLLHGGTNVWIANNTLDANHEPAGIWTFTEVSNSNDYPNDLRLLYIDWGPFAGRVVLTWTGQDPTESVPESKPYGRMAFADAPYDTWQLRTIEKNYGSNVYNSARVSFPLFRHAGGPNGTLIWVWEHLDMVSTQSAQTTAVQTHAAFSFDGGDTWGDCYAAPSQCYLIAPRGSSNFYFFPNGMVDQNDVLWVFFYWRMQSSGQGRRLAAALWDGPAWNQGWSNPINIWDAGGSTNIQFPAAVSTNEGSGNKIYVAVTNDAGALDKRLYVLTADGSFGSGLVYPAPRAAASPGVSPDFSTPQGPMGVAVSDANYNRRPVLNVVYTEDGIVWVPYMEAGNIFGVPNMWTWSSTDGFVAERTRTNVTADAFAKGHQMSDTLTIGSKSCVYEVWHENIAPTGEVNYDVYLAIYCAGWQTSPDNQGPITVNQATIPNPYNRTYPSAFRIKADINDISTGYNNISAAQLVPTALSVSDPSMVDWSNAWAMNLTGVDRSPSETAWVWANWTVQGWATGTCHRFWIRGQDELNNWGSGDYVDVCVTQALSKPPPPPVMVKAELTGPGFQDVTLTWGRSFDDGNGVNNVLLYKVWKADSINGPYNIAATVTATHSPTYTWPDTGAGHGEFQNHFYYVQANSSLYDSPPTKLAAKFYRTMSAGGKQLLSFPLLQADYKPSAVFQTLGFDYVRTYDPRDQDQWKSYKVGRQVNDITALDIHQAYWVDMTSGGTMTVAGLVAENVIIQLQGGAWNLLSFPSFNATYTLADLSAALGPVVGAIEVFDPNAGPYYLQRLSPTDWATTVMQPGLAYWIYVSSSTEWAVPAA